MINRSPIKSILEAALFSYEMPLSIQKMMELFEENERPQTQDILATLKELEVDYANRGIELKQIANGYRFQTRPEINKWLQKLWIERPQKYSHAFLETLALIVYRQPITRAEIEEVRGIALNPNIIKTLFERDWIKVVGHRDTPGKPELLGTTKTFLDYFNLKNLSELPSLQEVQNLNLKENEILLQKALYPNQNDASTLEPPTNNSH